MQYKMADNEVNVEMVATPRGKKRTLTPSEWKKNKIKAAKVKGALGITSASQTIPDQSVSLLHIIMKIDCPTRDMAALLLKYCIQGTLTETEKIWTLRP
ncbi:hypothetical protein GJAV_G00143230 [Gymnothorax javanicus]|nr:hypothetical protein GJAV_G00143230 [Gymnothorax javanicus]